MCASNFSRAALPVVAAEPCAVDVPDVAAAAEAPGSCAGGGANGAQVASGPLPALRAGSAPVAMYLAIRSSSHASPNSDSACDVPPGSASRLEFGYSLRTSRLPVYGVAASSVSSMSRTLATLLPSILTGV